MHRMSNLLHPIFKDIVSMEEELTGVRPQSSDLYALSDNLTAWEFLIPVGADGSTVYYDEMRVLHVEEIDARVKMKDVERLFSEVFSEVRARNNFGWNIRNTYNVLIADKIIGKFLSHKSRWNADGSRDYFYFFSSKLGANGIKARLYHLLGNFFKIRGERMDQNVKFPLYGKVKKIQEFFMSLGERMMKLSESMGWTKKKRAQSTEVREESTEERLGALLRAMKPVVPEEDWREVVTVLSLRYPNLMKREAG